MSTHKPPKSHPWKRVPSCTHRRDTTRPLPPRARSKSRALARVK
jgi:hypothetical protein